MSHQRIVVVGASAAGLAAAEALRAGGHLGELTVVGAEERPPYDRPPLSKQILRGAWDVERIALRRDEDLARLEATWRLGVRAEGLDQGAGVVALSDGTDLPYDALVIATGVLPRRVPWGAELRGVHVLRDLDDALALRAGLLEARSLVVIGGGFLGSEVAAVARDLGLDVTIVDPVPGPMVRQLGAYTSHRCAELHARHGTQMRWGTTVADVVADGGRVSAVELDDGSVVAADVVLVAIGSTPSTQWLAGSGLDLADGIACDEFCRAADNVVAAGDVASWAHPAFGRIRVEHRMNAAEHGAAAARTLLDAREPFAPVPYFWTDQYDAKIQAYGRPSDDAEFLVVDEGPGDAFAGVYAQEGRVVGAVAWNLPKAARRLRAEVMARSRLDAVGGLRVG